MVGIIRVFWERWGYVMPLSGASVPLQPWSVNRIRENLIRSFLRNKRRRACSLGVGGSWETDQKIHNDRVRIYPLKSLYRSNIRLTDWLSNVGIVNRMSFVPYITQICGKWIPFNEPDRSKCSLIHAAHRRERITWFISNGSGERGQPDYKGWWKCSRQVGHRSAFIASYLEYHILTQRLQ